MTPNTPIRACGLVSLLVVITLLFASLNARALPRAAEMPPGQAAEPAEKKSAGPGEVVRGASPGVERVPAKPGEICAVCYHPVGENDAVFFFRGHRLAIHVPEIQANLRAQLAYLAGQREPHGAFLYSEEEQRGLSMGWFLAGGYVLLGLIFAALCGHCALRKGYGGWSWFAAGMLLNVFAFAVLLTRASRSVAAPEGVPKGLSKIPATRRPVPCPGCGELNHPAARNCGGCNAELKPECDSEVSRARLGGARA